MTNLTRMCTSLSAFALRIMKGQLMLYMYMVLAPKTNINLDSQQYHHKIIREMVINDNN